MMRFLHRRALLLLPILFFSLCAGAQDGPPPEIRALLDSFAQALNGPSADGWEKFAQEHFTPAALQQRTPEQRKQIFENIRRDFGKVNVSRVERRGPDAPLRVFLEGATGAKAVAEIDLAAEPRFHIAKLMFRLGGAAEEERKSSVPEPTVNGKMADAELGKALDDYFTKLAAADSFSGNALVAKDGKPVFTKSYGFADRANKLANNAQTRFNLGSMNKSFTQSAIKQLVARGKLSLTDTVGKILPDYPQELTRTATVDQLLRHTAGVANFFGEEFDRTNKERFRTNADYYKFVSAQPPEFAPGARNEYCNGCYIVLGAIIERVSGVPYEQYVAENIYKPAGMTASGPIQADDINPNVAIGYTHRGADKLHANFYRHGASGSAAGGGYSTTGDLLAYAEALRQHRIPDVTVSGDMGIAGGAPGVSSALEESGPWTVIVLTNFDPPGGEEIAQAVAHALSR